MNENELDIFIEDFEDIVTGLENDFGVIIDYNKVQNKISVNELIQLYIDELESK